MDIYCELQWTDDQITHEVNKYPNIDYGTFCWMISKAYQNRSNPMVQKAIRWGELAVALNPDRFEFWNTLGIAYDDNNEY